jgi:hypothetical protein
MDRANDAPETTTIDDAIAAHLQWIGRFENALAGVDREPFDPVLAGDDTRCGFGRWLAAQDASADGAAFARIRELHREFHREAGRIAAMIGRAPSSVVALEKVRFDELSERLVTALFEARPGLADATPG